MMDLQKKFFTESLPKSWLIENYIMEGIGLPSPEI